VKAVWHYIDITFPLASTEEWLILLLCKGEEKMQAMVQTAIKHCDVLIVFPCL